MITVSSPSRIDFEHLSQLHMDTLNCRCSQIAISYSDFIEIVPTFHQLCSSRIISPDWYSLLARFNSTAQVDTGQFEIGLGERYFQILAMICSLARNTFINAYQSFSGNTFINTHAVSESLFSKQTNALTDMFIRMVQREFIRIFLLTRETTQAGQLITWTKSNFKFRFNSYGEIVIDDLIRSLIDTPSSSNILFMCSCQTLGFKCGTRTFVYTSSDTTSTHWDYETLTLTFQSENQCGLEIFDRPTNQWCLVEARDDMVVVNFGDIFEY
ncbi:unnamed protein product [Rotaria sp. Silwood2]|nr:unnamed protein product [Rotaria sp. Silwood2]